MNIKEIYQTKDNESIRTIALSEDGTAYLLGGWDGGGWMFCS